MSKPTGSKAADIQTQRQDFYQTINPLHLAPLWESFAHLITPEPRTPCVPHLWPYADVRPHVLASGELISAEEAERRVLVLENPALRGSSCITRSLYAGLQLVLPHEVAPCHRHAQSALRLIVEGSGAYTAVDGEPVYMEPGDFIITSSWAWHDHGNETGEPVVWLDGLDIPMVQFFDASFVERYPEPSHPATRPAGTSAARFGRNMLPVNYGHRKGRFPLFSYPYARSREALDLMAAESPPDPWQGVKMEFVNPLDGGPAMATISSFIQHLPAGMETKPLRSTDGTVFHVIEGSGESTINGQTFTWGPKDTFVVPSWHAHRMQAGADAVLFSFSDRGVQQKLNLWREEKLEA